MARISAAHPWVAVWHDQFAAFCVQLAQLTDSASQAKSPSLYIHQQRGPGPRHGKRRHPPLSSQSSPSAPLFGPRSPVDLRCAMNTGTVGGQKLCLSLRLSQLAVSLRRRSGSP